MEDDGILKSLSEACRYGKVTRQAIFKAIRLGHLKAYKVPKGNQEYWHIAKKDLDEYRLARYHIERRKKDGQQIIDLDKDRWSVKYVAKVLSVMTGRHYPPAHIYYLLRIGQLKGSKMGGLWVISKEDGHAILNHEMKSTPREEERLKFFFTN